MYTNRVRAILDAMTKNETVDDEVETTPEAEPKNVFAKNFARFMFLANKTAEQLAAETQVDRRRIDNLKSAGLRSMENVKKPDDIHKLAAALNCSPEDLFRDPNAPPAADPKAEEMLRVALTGPKRSFVLDALQMAYVAALTSKSSYS
jgi:transcriptional regulator with XRE-family HTH domain